MSEVKTPRYHVRRREFLNKDPEMSAFIIGVVQDTREKPEADKSWATVQLDLADCHRKVSFDFSMCDAEERANSLHKINLIAEVVNAVRDAIALEVELQNARSTTVDATRGAVA